MDNDQAKLVSKIQALAYLQDELINQLRCGLQTKTLDQRWISIGQTHFEQGIMALRKGTFV